MWALIARFVGPYITRTAVRKAAQTLIKDYGAKGVQNLAKTIAKMSPADIAKLSADDLVTLVRSEAATQGELFAAKTFSASNAKKFANIVNKKIDWLEKTFRDYLERRSLQMMDQRMVNLVGRPGVSRATGKQLLPQGESSLRRRFGIKISNFAEEALFPSTTARAFGVGYIRGISGETLAFFINRTADLILGGTRTVTAIPKLRAFWRVLAKEVRYLRQIGDITSARKLYNAIRQAQKAYGSVYGTGPRAGYEVAGNISGRITVAGITQFGFQDEDERKRRIQKFRKSIKPFAKKQFRTWVNSYTRDDGTRVRGHYRTYTTASYA